MRCVTQDEVTDMKCYRDLLFQASFYCLTYAVLWWRHLLVRTPLMPFLFKNIPQRRANVLYKAFDDFFRSLST